MEVEVRSKRRQLLIAVREGKLPEVTSLLASLDLTDSDKFNYLYYAIFYNQFGVTKYLIENGFDQFLNINRRSKQLFGVAGQNSIYYGTVDIVEILLKNGVDFCNFSADALLEAAAKEGNLKFIRSLALKVKGRDQARLLKKTLTNSISGDLRLQNEIFQTLLNYGSKALLPEEFCAILYFAWSRENKSAVRSLLTRASDFEAEKLLKVTITQTTGWLPKILQVLLEYGTTDSGPVMDSKMFSSLFEALNKPANFLKYHKSCAIILVNHIIKLRVACLYDSKESFRSVVYSNESEMAEFQSQCEAELAKMIEERIGMSHITYYAILAKSIPQLSKLAKNESIVETLKSSDYKLRFPIYSGLINSQFEKGEIRRDLIKRGKKIYRSLLTNFSSLPDNLMEQIVVYSSNKDLQNLILATEPVCSLPANCCSFNPNYCLGNRELSPFKPAFRRLDLDNSSSDEE